MSDIAENSIVEAKVELVRLADGLQQTTLSIEPQTTDTRMTQRVAVTIFNFLTDSVYFLSARRLSSSITLSGAPRACHRTASRHRKSIAEW